MVTNPYLVHPGGGFRLADRHPGDTGEYRDKEEARKKLEEDIRTLSELQDVLYAQNSHGILLIFQAMDAAGKDSAIKHVMSGVNPQGCQVTSFKAPSAEELDHDFLWRCTKALPERGRIGIFNRSHYEEVLVVRVHQELLERQRLPRACTGPDIWKDRFEDINAMERYLIRNGFVVLKFFLHVSREEQKKRFLERIERPEKNWKFSIDDVHERDHWDTYMKAYEEMLANTSTPWAPWYCVPADHKWFTRMVLADVVVRSLQSLDLRYPEETEEHSRDLEKARLLLEQEE
jgi:PPK2 family polyphosphate:nucleotide phosphotransferase